MPTEKAPETRRNIRALKNSASYMDALLTKHGYPASEGVFARVLGSTAMSRHMIETIAVICGLERRELSPDHEFYLLDECRSKTCPDHGTTLDHANLSDLRLALDRIGALEPDQYYAHREDHLRPILELIKAYVRKH